MSEAPGADRGDLTRDFIEAGIKVGALLLLAVACFRIVAPFLVPVIWATIIAVAVHPAYVRLAAVLGNRAKLAAVLLVALGLTVLIVPLVATSTSMIGGMKTASEMLQHGGFELPPPPADVGDWPLIGGYVLQIWTLASDNLEALMIQLKPQLAVVGGWLAAAVGGVGADILQFIVSILIAGAFLVNAEASQRAIQSIARRIAGAKADDFLDLAAATVRSVVHGVLGIAVIQAILAGIGMAVAGVPASGLWALLVLVAAVVQLPSFIVLGPVAIYVFATANTTAAVLFAIWAVFVGTSDTFLKPLLLGRGLEIPMLVILVGAIGGLMAFGIVGLFVGAVALGLGYEILQAWLAEADAGASKTETGLGAGS
jgi:predicted PurR-regulated permease PerM